MTTDCYSAIWESDEDYEAFLDVVDQYDFDEDVPTILYTEENPENDKITLKEARKRLNNETPKFIRVNSDSMDLTYDRRENVTMVGVIFDDINIRTLEEIYEETTAGGSLGDALQYDRIHFDAS